MIFCFPIKSYDFWLINYLFGLISINYLFGFNIKDNGIRYYNFDIVLCFELSILLWGENAKQPESVHVMDQGPNPRTRDSPRTRKTLPKGFALVSEGMESNRNHSGSGSRKSPSSARQCLGENGWLAIKSDAPNHFVEHDKY